MKGSLDGLQPAFRARVEKMIAHVQSLGDTVTIVWGYRSTAEQTILWNNRASNPNPVARPGFSPHEAGLAVDLHFDGSVSRSAVGHAAIDFGLRWGGGFQHPDPPHFEWPGFIHGQPAAGQKAVEEG